MATQLASRILVDSAWYARLLGAPAVSLDDLLAERCPRWLVRLAGRVGVVRGLLAFRAAGEHERIVVLADMPGSATVLALEAWLRSRRAVVFLQLVWHAESPVWWRRRLRRAWRAVVIGPALRRALRVGHALTAWERDELTRQHGLEADRVRLVPWPWRLDDEYGPQPAPRRGARSVMSSGYTLCDWPTLFAASRERAWDLTVVCSAADRPVVDALNCDGRAQVLSEIPRSEHLELMRRATVYVLCLCDRQTATGHGRLAHAAQAGVAVVATDVRGLEGYVVPDETCLLVPAEAPAALAEAVDALLTDPARRDGLAMAADRRSRAWPYAAYIEGLRRLVFDQPSVERAAS